VKPETIAARYLRAAHAYMLISMPTGTSTIFGAFQAIWLSFWNRTHSALVHKVMPNENFANEIFFPQGFREFFAAARQQWADRRRDPAKPLLINGFGDFLGEQGRRRGSGSRISAF
jgi:hypothetical protein